MKSLIDETKNYSPTKFLTVNEVAFQLSISKSKVYELLKNGSIQAVTMGRSKRVKPADLDRYVEMCKTAEVEFVKSLG